MDKPIFSNKECLQLAASTIRLALKSVYAPAPIISLFAVLTITYAGLYSYKQYSSKGGDAVAGKAVYMTYCESCHGSKGHGDGPVASSLPHRPANISRRISGLFVYDSSLIQGVILRGRINRSMPAFQDVVTEGQAKDVLAFVRAVNLDPQ